MRDIERALGGAGRCTYGKGDVKLLKVSLGSLIHPKAGSLQLSAAGETGEKTKIG